MTNARHEVRLTTFPRLFTAAFTLSVALGGGLSACSDDPEKSDAGAADAGGGNSDTSAGSDATAVKPVDEASAAKLAAVKAGAEIKIPGLQHPAHVVRTEAGIPHIYAYNEHDLYAAAGYVVAADRYFFMLMGAKLGQGRIAEVLGDAAIDSDYDSRFNGASAVATKLLSVMTPHQKVVFGAYVEGINAYVADAKAGKAPMPTELKVAAPLLGKKPAEMLEKFELRDAAGFAAVVVYQLGYETGDVGRGHKFKLLNTHFKGVFEEDLRRAGAIEDIWKRVVPPTGYSSAHGWKTETEATKPPPPPSKSPADAPGSHKIPQTPESPRGAGKRPFAAGAPHVPAGLLERLMGPLDAWQKLMKRDHDIGFGSNAWAVGKGSSKDGKGLLAGDGHLPMTIPSYFYQIGMDTRVLGGGEVHQTGLVIPGMPIMAVGTNGDVAWCQTQLFGDITDWYVEELQLDANGKPKSTTFKGKDEPLQSADETFVIAELKSPILPSKGGTETWTRYTTFDGRWIAEIEGDKVKKDHKPGKGETVVNLGGTFVVPKDTDKDGKITAISFDYTGLDDGNMLLGLESFGRSKNVADMRESMRYLVAYSQNIAAADADGGVMYSGYQGVPCRKNLPRDANGEWLPGADPSQLLDGTKYGGFTIPIKDGKVDETPGKTDPSKCVVPFESYPMALNPTGRIVVTANNDIGDITHDNSLTNDEWYVGGPWMYGFRAQRIADLLGDKAKAGATLADMSEIQGDVKSPLGALHTAWLVKQLEAAADLAATDGLKSDEEERVVGLYAQLTATDVDDVIKRLKGWEKAGFVASSGVETFYTKPTDQTRANAVATTIFNAWFARFRSLVLDDEPMPGAYRFSNGSTRAVNYFVAGIGADNPLKQASFYKPTGQSIFFDRVGTAEVETARECALQAMIDAVAYLSSEVKDEGTGGFGSADHAKWLWGLRHQVKFESTIADFFSAAEGLTALTDQFAITTERLPLLGETKIEKGDPRRDLKWFPRQGDAFAVDAAGGVRTGDWQYGSGPVFRMAIALHRDDKGEPVVEGVNVVPGGQSAITDSPFFHDQAELWLQNKTVPMRYSVDQVVQGAVSRDSFTP